MDESNHPNIEFIYRHFINSDGLIIKHALWLFSWVYIIPIHHSLLQLFFFRILVICLKKSNRYVYINFQLAVYVNNILTFLLGFCCFFGTIKFLRLWRFNQRLSLFTKTLKYASKELLSFAMMFSIVFMAFIYYFFQIFDLVRVFSVPRKCFLKWQ
jgi:hypothetical protein